MSLLFGPDGKFIKITHEYANYAPPVPVGCATLIVGLLALLAAIGVALR
jgi:hypothetical protein